MSIRVFFVVGVSTGLLALNTSPGFAQDYPSKPIRIVTSGAGGGSDFDARLIAQAIAAPLGQPVIVDNQRSAPISIEVGAKMPSDGYNLLVVGESLWQLPFLQNNVGYDPVRDFAPITIIERNVNIVTVHPSVPVKSIKELIDLAKARPGELNYGSGGIGGAAHLAGELFKSMAGVNIVHVPYKGGAATITALLSGEVQILITSTSVIMPQVKLGKLRGLAVTSAQPSLLAPGLPTVSASGVPGYEATGVTGIVAPSKTPPAIILRLNQEIVRAINQPDIKEKLLTAGVEPVANSPEDYAARIKAEIPRMGKVIKDAGITPQ